MKRIYKRNLVCHTLMILVLVLSALYISVRDPYITSYKSDQVKDTTYTTYQAISEEQTLDEVICCDCEYSKDWNEDDTYLLAKIAMAEAEGCDQATKELIVSCVLNRVWSNEFPNTIQEVIFQKQNGVYQFTPVSNGRWDRVEPNKDCFDAVYTVMQSDCDFSRGALYFESCKNEDNWHSRNLDLICESDGMRFYK